VAEAAGASRDPRTQDVREVLDRVVTRWHQLTLEQASSRAAEVRACALLCVDLAHPREAGPGSNPVLPDVGPTAAVDQLQVTVFDACAAGLAERLPHTLTDLLVRLR